MGWFGTLIVTHIVAFAGGAYCFYRYAAKAKAETKAVLDEAQKHI